MSDNLFEGEEIIRLAGRGDGMTASGQFVAGTAPGDHVIFEGEKPRIIKGPHHQQAACVHYGRCGGCQLQHVDDESYATWARDRIVHALHQHKIEAHTILPVTISPPATRRRIALRARRMGKKIVMGFNAEASHDIIDISQCPIMLPTLLQLLPPLRALLGRVLDDRQTIGVSLTQSDQGIDVLLANMVAERLDVIEALTGFAAEQDLARLSVEDSNGVSTIAERRAVTLRMGGVDVALPPAPFLQATRDGEAALVRAVEEICAGASHVTDLFCGLGTFALPLSQKSRVMAADGARAAFMALDASARGAGRAIKVQHRDLFRNPLQAAELSSFDAVVIDPPRAGAQAQAVCLAQSSVAVVASVSCNPATFARDAKILVDGGYILQRLWPVAQFRWSNHIELVGEFKRAS